MSAPLIQIEHVYKVFSAMEVLRGVNLDIGRGDSVVIIGQSGCGKSVLLKHIIRLLEPDRGQVIVDNSNLADLNSRELSLLRRRVGMLFQSAALFDSLTVEENVGLGLRESRRYDTDEIHERVMDKLGMVGLRDAAQKYPAELSGGMRKRVGLARAIAEDPEILLYDEPTTGLDPITSDMINDMIVELNEKLNVTSVAVTHDMRSAYKIADRIVMLYKGRVEIDGSPDEIKNTDNGVVRQFVTGSARGPISVN